jgi:hypothetical protein
MSVDWPRAQRRARSLVETGIGQRDSMARQCRDMWIPGDLFSDLSDYPVAPTVRFLVTRDQLELAEYRPQRPPIDAEHAS